MIRECEHTGFAGPHLRPSVIDEFFADLPDRLKEDLRDVMTEGVKVDISRDLPTGKATPSRTAVEHRDLVLAQLRKFTALGQVRAFPPSLRSVLKSWNIVVSPAHIVPSTKWKQQDRLVANLGKPADGLEEHLDVNSRSEDTGYDDVQADYIDVVVLEFIEFLRKSKGMSDAVLIQIGADIKAAFKTVVLSLDSMGCLCIEFEGWLYVYTRTAFGWKWATHSWSIIAKAIKHKVRCFERNDWNKSEARLDWLRITVRARMMAAMRMRATNSKTAHRILVKMKNDWRMNFISMYVDDLHGFTAFSLKKARRLADAIRISGTLLLGPSAWSISKAGQEGFFSWMQKYTGIVINTKLRPGPRLSFTEKRIDKCLEIVEEALKPEYAEQMQWPFGLLQGGAGNWVWFTKVYWQFKAFCAAYRRPLQGMLSSTDPRTMVSPKHGKESQEAGARKFVKDNITIRTMLLHLKRLKQKYGEGHIESTVTMESIIDVSKLDNVDDDVSLGSIGGDASGRGWSVFDHRNRKMMDLQMPKILQDVISRRSQLQEGDVREQFMIAIAEHLVLVFALLQWGPRWKAQGYTLIRYVTDNMLSFHWTDKMFASCEAAQDLCRLIAVLCLTYGLRISPVWVDSETNEFADLRTRQWDEEGNTMKTVTERFERLNSAMDQPYSPEEPSPAIHKLVGYFAAIKSPFKLHELLTLEVEGLLADAVTVGAAEVFPALSNSADLQAETTLSAKSCNSSDDTLSQLCQQLAVEASAG